MAARTLCREKMLTVRLVSGHLLAAIPTQELSTVRALKQRLHSLCDAARFRQLLLHEGKILEDDLKLDCPLELQLVLLTFINPTRKQVAEIFRACWEGNVSELEEILSRPQDPNHFTPHVFRYLPVIFDDIPLAALSPASPLQIAANFGKLDAIRLLLEAQADLGPAGCSMTSLVYIRPHGSLDAMKLLLEARADAENINVHNGQSALSVAAHLGRSGAVQVLLEGGAQKDLENNHGVTPLLNACWSGHVHIVHQLLVAGAKPAACSKKGISHLAAKQGRELLPFQRLLPLSRSSRATHRMAMRLLIRRLLTASRWLRARRRVATHQLLKPSSK